MTDDEVLRQARTDAMLEQAHVDRAYYQKRVRVLGVLLLAVCVGVLWCLGWPW